MHRVMEPVGASIGSLVLFVSLLGTGTQASGAQLPVECGSTIASDITLHADVGPCPGDGLVVVASGITIDLNGYKVFATQRANVGVRIENERDVTVKGGTVDGFDVGVFIVGGLLNTVSHMTVQNNRFGIQLENAESSGHRIEKNLVTKNRLIGILLRRFVSSAAISKNAVSGNAGFGIVVAGGSSLNTVEGNDAFDNGDAGIAARTEEYILTRTNVGPPVLDLMSPDRPPYINGVDYQAMAGDRSAVEVTGRLVPINIALSPTATSLANLNPADTSTSGCNRDDYSAAGFRPGDVALLQRGTCTLDIKIQAAANAGASGVVMFNEGQAPDRTTFDFGALGLTPGGPVISTTYSLGFDLYNLTRTGPVIIRLFANMALAAVVLDTPATHNNLFTKNSTNLASEENSGCGSNQWIKNDLGNTGAICETSPPTTTGATSHNY